MSKKRSKTIWINKWMDVANQAGSAYLTDKFNRATGLNFTQFAILACTARNRGINQQDISFITLYDKSVVSRSLKLLEKNGYVHRVRDESDTRNVHVYITEEGWKLQEKNLAEVQKWNELVLSYMDIPEGMTKEDVNEICKEVAFASFRAFKNPPKERMSDWMHRIDWNLEDLMPPLE